MENLLRLKLTQAAMGLDEVELSGEQILEVPDAVTQMLDRIEPIIDEELSRRPSPTGSNRFGNLLDDSGILGGPKL